MNINESVKTCLNKYMDFSGRASRSEFWWWTLASSIVGFIVFLATVGSVDNIFAGAGLGLVFYLLYGIAALLPTLAVAARRLHDSGKNAWFLLITFVPFIGGIVLLILLVLDSDKNSNQYGPRPKD